MSLKDPDKIMEALRQPIHPDDLEWRLQNSGRSGDKVWALALVYVTNRAIQERFDRVCGPFWQVQHRFVQLGDETACITGISVKIDGEWILREDGSDPSKQDAVKGAMSGGMKRAAVQWGVGRDLYKFESGFCETTLQDPRNNALWTKVVGKGETPTFWWRPPMIPAWYSQAAAPRDVPAVAADPFRKAPTTTGTIAAPAPAPAPGVVDQATIAKVIGVFASKGVKEADLVKHLGGVEPSRWTEFHLEILRDYVAKLP